MSSSASSTSSIEMFHGMNDTLQSNTSSSLPPSNNAHEELLAKVVIITVASCCTILLLGISILCCKHIFLFRRRQRCQKKYSYPNDAQSKSKVSFLFESGSILELDDKIDEISNSDSTSRLLVPDVASYTDEVSLFVDLSSFSRGIPTMKNDESRLLITETNKSLLEHDRMGDSSIHRESEIPLTVPRIMKVKPLLALDKKENGESPVQTVSSLETATQHLDWNKVFSFLVNTINPSTWKLFFIDLFGCGQHLLPRGMRINSIIGRTELSNKGATSTLFFALFEEWLKLMGREASPMQIENALEERGDNDALERFKEFMRTPPLMPKESEKPKVEFNFQENLNMLYPNLDMLKFNPNLSGQSPQMQVMALHNVIHTQSCYDVRGSQNAGRAVIKSLPAGQRNKQVLENVSMALSEISKDDRVKSTSKVIIGSRAKRQREDITLPFISDVDQVPCKCRKYDNNALSVMKRTGSKRKDFDRSSAYNCRELVQWENIGNGFIIELIKRILPSESQVLKSEEYYLFLYHTVSAIMQKCGVSEKVVLSVLFEDFNELQEYKTKRGHTTCIIDTSACVLTLGYEECTNLKLYAEYARPRIIRRLIEENSDYVKSKYLFIDYNGLPVVEKPFKNKQNREERTAVAVMGMPTYESIGKSSAAHCIQDEHPDQTFCATESVDPSDSNSEAWTLSQTANTFDITAILPSVNGTAWKGLEYTASANVVEKTIQYKCEDTLDSNPEKALRSYDGQGIQTIAFSNDKQNTHLVYDQGEMKQDANSVSDPEQNVESKIPAGGEQEVGLFDKVVKAEGIDSFIDDISKLLSDDKMS